jgi:hypothetical protein
MFWLVGIVGCLILAVSCVLTGFILSERRIGKFRKEMLKYMSLTPKSKRLVNGYIDSRMINDERTHYRERQ